jgi:hypothetical protein
MKKTKLIKEKVVRSGNQALEPIIKQKQPVANAQHPGERNRGYK